MSHCSQVEEFAAAELAALAPLEGAHAEDAADASNGSEVTTGHKCLQRHNTYVLHCCGLGTTPQAPVAVAPQVAIRTPTVLTSSLEPYSSRLDRTKLYAVPLTGGASLTSVIRLQPPTFAEAERRCSLFCVLCTKRHGLMRRLAEVFGRAAAPVRCWLDSRRSHAVGSLSQCWRSCRRPHSLCLKSSGGM